LHLVAGEHPDLPEADLPFQSLVGADEELLARLSACVERARDLGAAEGPVREQPAVLAREGDSLRGALVDDVDRQLREPVDVRLARAEVAALDRVVEEAEDRVAVVLVVLRGVDPALRRDRMGAPGRVLIAERLDVVPQLGERRGGGGPGEPGASSRVTS